MRRNQIWKCRDGKLINVSDMTDQHVSNTLAMLRRQGFIGRNTLEAYLAYPPPQGDMASYYYEQELDRVFSRPVNDWVDVFEEEVKRRHID